MAWPTRRQDDAVTETAGPLLMGILNVTPDSFSDGGRFFALEAACAQAEALLEAGADWLDIGGESSRPGAAPVAAEEEAARVLPVISALRARHPEVPISIDTWKADVAEAALAAGATAVNDISALRDPRMAEVVARAGCDVVLMHMRGDPQTMQDRPQYADPVSEIGAFLSERRQVALDAGVAPDRIWLDPGIGFGKTLEHNLALIRGLPKLSALGAPIVVGASRKSFLGRILSREAPEDRVVGSLAVAAVATWLGVSMLRVHDVKETYEVVRTVRAIARPVG